MKRHKNEGPFKHTRMRDNKLRVHPDFIAEKQQIQIDGTRAESIFFCPVASQFGFNGEQRAKQSRRPPLRAAFQFEHLIVEPGLIAFALGLGFVDRGGIAHGNAPNPRQSPFGVSQLPDRIAEIRPKPNKNTCHHRVL